MNLKCEFGKWGNIPIKNHRSTVRQKVYSIQKAPFTLFVQAVLLFHEEKKIEFLISMYK